MVLDMGSGSCYTESNDNREGGHLMAVEKGDWVRTKSGIEGEVIEVRNGKAVVRSPHALGRITTSTDSVRVTTRPQTGLRKGGK
jgi:preprotein translocase subunit YajC